MTRIGRATSSRFGRLVALVAVVALGGGVVAFTTPTGAAQAAEDKSAVTVAWAGGNAPEIQKYQPSREGLAPGFVEDFRNLKVTVSQTRDLQDQSVTVRVEGMKPTPPQTTPYPMASNFVQLMQCWGPDPSAADFAQTCQFGANSSTAGSEAAEFGWTLSGAGQDTTRRYVNYDEDSGEAFSYPFRAAHGAVSSPRLSTRGGVVDGTDEFFTPSTSNELPLVRLNADGVASTPFEIQTAAAAPQLGCGDENAPPRLRCWLVIVPRGEHWGARADDGGCAAEHAKGNPRVPDKPVVPGDGTIIQVGSPVSPMCSYFDHRIVVPLDFSPAFVRCTEGAKERRIVGSEFAVVAVSSWQSALCVGDGAATYNLTTNSGLLNRGQLLTGQARLALTTLPVEETTVPADVAATLPDADIAYAPVVNTGLVLGFVAENFDQGRVDSIKLTPRLVAKLLTQLYSDQLPWVSGSGAAAPPFSVGAGSIASDPEWKAAGNVGGLVSRDSVLVSLGPRGDDSIRLLWQWIQADEKAAAWLRGEPDNIRPGDERNAGYTVNPYYLPSGNQKSLGGGLPYDLSKFPIDTIPRADQTKFPETSDPNKFAGNQLDSITLMPFAGSFQHTATRVLRGDSQVTSEWDPGKRVSAGVVGAFVPRPPTPAGQRRLVMGPMDAPTAERFGLAVASLQLPNRPDTFVSPSDATMTSALSAQRVDERTGVATSVDWAALSTDAYPLTSTVYAAGDTNVLEAGATDSREYARFVRYAAGDGQIRGTARGQLPAGYVPLTEAQRDRATSFADTLEGASAGADAPAGAATGSNAPRNASAGGVGAPDPASNAPNAQTALSSTSRPAVEATAVSGPAPLQSAVGVALAAGIVGAIAAPILLRRRERSS